VKTGRKKISKAPAKSSAKKSKPKKSPASAAKKASAKRIDALLDRELEETFPASDPLELTEPGGPRKSPAPRNRRR
jgi:hypothetical protein